jgi:hypothetical protein
MGITYFLFSKRRDVQAPVIYGFFGFFSFHFWVGIHVFVCQFVSLRSSIEKKLVASVYGISCEG